jgi:hypothetical protein
MVYYNEDQSSQSWKEWNGSPVELINQLLQFIDYIWLESTGIKDKLGKMIYDGDIISDGRVIHVIERNNDEASYQAKLINGSSGNISQKWISEFEKEVIGNIYENHDLFK